MGKAGWRMREGEQEEAEAESPRWRGLHKLGCCAQVI